jgi:CubicO group peptidase (beta-lactamase class C family)
MMFLTLIILILKSLQAQSQFSNVTEAIISDMYRTSYFTSGHEAVFEVNVSTNRITNIYEQFYGLHDREHNYPMSRSSQFRVGSNSKCFTSIAIMQLHESGKLNIDHDIKDYLSADDLKTLGYNRSVYCPVLYNANTNTLNTTCQKITFRNLLSMQSGIINSVTCTYKPNDWQRKYCQPAYVSSWWYGSTADTIKFFINSPLEYVPGTTYSYTNENQLFLSYFIEKISGMKLEIYFKEKIFEPLDMKNTFLDSLDGELSARTNLVSGYWDYTDLTRSTSYFAYGKIQSTEAIQGVLSGDYPHINFATILCLV